MSRHANCDLVYGVLLDGETIDNAAAFAGSDDLHETIGSILGISNYTGDPTDDLPCGVDYDEIFNCETQEHDCFLMIHHKEHKYSTDEYEIKSLNSVLPVATEQETKEVIAFCNRLGLKNHKPKWFMITTNV